MRHPLVRDQSVLRGFEQRLKVLENAFSAAFAARAVDVEPKRFLGGVSELDSRDSLKQLVLHRANRPEAANVEILVGQGRFRRDWQWVVIGQVQDRGFLGSDRREVVKNSRVVE